MIRKVFSRGTWTFLAIPNLRGLSALRFLTSEMRNYPARLLITKTTTL